MPDMVATLRSLLVMALQIVEYILIFLITIGTALDVLADQMERLSPRLVMPRWARRFARPRQSLLRAWLRYLVSLGIIVFAINAVGGRHIWHVARDRESAVLLALIAMLVTAAILLVALAVRVYDYLREDE